MSTAESPSVPVLRASILTSAGFRHGFTTRLGGVSPAPFATLDFAVLRDAALLRENQERLGRAVGFARAVLHQTRQVHGKAILVADGEPERMLEREADALVAEPASGHAVAVRVADCVPVLLADVRTGRVAAVHAGWRGVEARIVEETVRHLARARGDEANVTPGAAMLAAIGPSIGRCCFEVGVDVGERIVRVSSREAIAATRVADGKAMVDLRRAIRTQLGALGFSEGAIEDVPGCTRCDAERFYSYRRDGDASGRLVGVIVPM